MLPDLEWELEEDSPPLPEPDFPINIPEVESEDLPLTAVVGLRELDDLKLPPFPASLDPCTYAPANNKQSVRGSYVIYLTIAFKWAFVLFLFLICVFVYVSCVVLCVCVCV